MLGALPAYILTRGGAEWIASKEDLSDSEVTWIGIGYGTSDVGLLLMIVATVATGLVVRRMAGADAAAGGGRGVTIAAWLVALLIIAYAVAVWAMAAKPV